MSRFRAYNPEQAYLLPPSVRDELGADHLCFFLRKLVSRLDLSRFAAAAFSKGRVAMHARNLSEAQQHVIEEEAQPDAFAFAVLADKVHAIVPVTGTH